MLLTHNAQMERIINLIMEMKEEGKFKGKKEKEGREVYFPNEDKFF